MLRMHAVQVDTQDACGQGRMESKQGKGLKLESVWSCKARQSPPFMAIASRTTFSGAHGTQATRCTHPMPRHTLPPFDTGRRWHL